MTDRIALVFVRPQGTPFSDASESGLDGLSCGTPTSADGEGSLSLEFELQKQIVCAKHRLAQEKTATKSVRKQRKDDLKKAKEKVSSSFNYVIKTLSPLILFASILMSLAPGNRYPKYFGLSIAVLFTTTQPKKAVTLASWRAVLGIFGQRQSHRG